MNNNNKLYEALSKMTPVDRRMPVEENNGGSLYRLFHDLMQNKEK
jgi:hypothetical protein